MPRPSMMRDRLWSAGPYLALVALNLAFRFPLLLNASAVHSDTAIVGLQALRALNGEHSRFLWGADYQGSFDVYVVATFFLLGGATPLMLMLAPLLGHLVLSFSVLGMLTRTLQSRLAALVATLPIVFTPQAVTGVVAWAPRQWSITFAVCGAVIIAWPTTRWVPARIGGGLLLAISALYLDMFCMQWMPAIGVLAVLACFDAPRGLKPIAIRFGAVAVFSGIGVWLLRVLRDSGAPKQNNFGFDFSLASRNWPLLSETCLPWLLGTKVWIPGSHLTPDLWNPPGAVRAFQFFGGYSIFVLALAALGLAGVRRVPWEVKRLSVFGWCAAGTAVGGFLVSGWPADMWSSRYLAPVVWSLPFTLAPLARVLRPRGFAALLAPYLAVAAMGGWLSNGPFVEGPLPRRSERASLKDETALRDFLLQRGYHQGYAQYWLAHRLTFLWGERPALASFEPNRYPPYQLAADRAKRRAYIFHPTEPRAQPEPYLASLRAQPGTVEVHTVAGFTVLLYQAPD